MEHVDDIQQKVLEFAEQDARIRAVLLNGSRANPKIASDRYQDYDLVFVVRDLYSFVHDLGWLGFFGKPMLQQFPDEIKLGNDPNVKKVSFTILTIFEDGTRIDLTLFPEEQLLDAFTADSLTVVWVDKDNCFRNVAEASERDYYVSPPSQSEFYECCNEFWWVVTYVAKGLKRGEIIYAKAQWENAVRPMFWKLMEWEVGFEHDFKINLGKTGKFAAKWLTESDYKNVLKTYADADIENNWNALLLMADLFKEKQERLGAKLNFEINKTEAGNSLAYIHKIRLD